MLSLQITPSSLFVLKWTVQQNKKVWRNIKYSLKRDQRYSNLSCGSRDFKIWYWKMRWPPSPLWQKICCNKMMFSKLRPLVIYLRTSQYFAVVSLAYLIHLEFFLKNPGLTSVEIQPFRTLIRKTGTNI